MNTKMLKILAAITLIVVLAAVAVRLSSERGESEPLPEHVLPTLEERINDVAAIEVVSGAETLSLARNDGSWVVSSKAGYPAKFETVKQALVSVADLKPRERKTSDPARYERLGLEEPAEGSAAVRLTLRDASGQDVGGVVLGEELFEGGTSQRYVRTLAEPQAWLAEGRVSVPTDPLQWLEREILRIPRDRVTRVTITHPDGEVVSIAREEGGAEYTLASVPEGRLPKSPSEVGAPASALSSLRLDDVRASSEPGFELAAPTVAVYETDSGLKLTVETWQVEEQTWARVRAEAPPPPAQAEAEPAAPASAEPDAGQAADAADASGSDQAEETEPSDEESAAKEAEEINARVSGWLYAIPDYQATSLRKRLADLVAEPEPAQPAEPAAEEEGEAPFFPSLDARDDPGDGG